MGIVGAAGAVMPGELLANQRPAARRLFLSSAGSGRSTRLGLVDLSTIDVLHSAQRSPVQKFSFDFPEPGVVFGIIASASYLHRGKRLLARSREDGPKGMAIVTTHCRRFCGPLARTKCPARSSAVRETGRLRMRVDRSPVSAWNRPDQDDHHGDIISDITRGNRFWPAGRSRAGESERHRAPRLVGGPRSGRR